MSKYLRTQIIFIIAIGISVIFWVYYFSISKMSIIIPVIFILIALEDFYDFIKCYLALSGCLPSDMKKFVNEIKRLKKDDKYKFTENALKKED